MPRDLPTGTVTFLFTDIEGSTRLLRQLGPDLYAEALTQHRRVLRNAFAAEGGVEVDTQGDALFVAFPTAAGAVTAAGSGSSHRGRSPCEWVCTPAHPTWLRTVESELSLGPPGGQWDANHGELERLVLRADGPAFSQAREEGSLMSIGEAAGLVPAG